MSYKSVQEEVIKILECHSLTPGRRFTYASRVISESSIRPTQKSWLKDQLIYWLDLHDRITDCIGNILSDPRETLDFPELRYEEIGPDSDN